MAVRIRIALRWLTKALQSFEEETQFLNFAIALEAMFTVRSSEYKIGLLLQDCVSRCASWSDPDGVKKLVRALYKRRSGIAHEGVFKQFYNEMHEIHLVVVQCLGEIMQKELHKKSYKEALEILNIDLDQYRIEAVKSCCDE